MNVLNLVWLMCFWLFQTSRNLVDIYIPKQFQPKVFGDRIHSDLCGEFPTSITGKFIYILCFVDSATGYSEIYLLQSKLASEVKPHFERFVKKWKHLLPDGVVREWFTDNGTLTPRNHSSGPRCLPSNRPRKASRNSANMRVVESCRTTRSST